MHFFKKNISTKVCFIHLAKTGGMSISNALKSKYRSTKQVGFDIHAYYRSIHTNGFDSSRDKDRDLRYSFLEYFLNSNMHFIHGHFAINDEIIERFPEYLFVTVLRDPISRLRSNILYDLSHGKIKIDPSNYNEELNEFLLSDRGKFLCNLTAFTYGGLYSENNERFDYNGSLTCLQKFDIVGRTEKMEDFQDSLESSLKTKLNIPHINKTKSQDQANLQWEKIMKNDQVNSILIEHLTEEILVYNKLSDFE